MNIGRFILLSKWLCGRLCDSLSGVRQRYSSEVVKCILNNGYVESDVKVFSAFKYSIHIGKNVKIGKGTVISNYEMDGQVHIGDGTSIGWYNNFYCQGGLEIGRNVLFASNVCILTSNHKHSNVNIPIKDQGSSYAPVRIGDDSWIGYNVIILPGVSIGKHTVIGAGSIVTHDMPNNAICAGNPCRLLHHIDKDSNL